MKLLHPLPDHLKIQPPMKYDRPRGGYKNMYEAIGEVQKEVRLGGLKFAALHTDGHYNQNGKLLSISEEGMPAAVFEFRSNVGKPNEEKHFVIQKTHSRTPDNIFSIAKVLKHRRMIMKSKVTFKSEKMRVEV